MQRLHILNDPFDTSAWEVIDCEDVRAVLANKFTHFPETARLYHGAISEQCDVTPHTEKDVEFLATLEGDIYLVVYPQDPITLLIGGLLLVSAVALIYRPKIPTAALRNQTLGSANNSLSERTNQVRINGRIPDIFGTVRSVPDMIMFPYTVFDNHVELDYAYMCIGRGSYAYPLVDGEPSIRDGETLVEKIEGSRLSIYAPNTSPNSGDAPEVEIGGSINEPVIMAKRSKAVNGQVLRAPNDAGDARIVASTNLIRFEPGGIIQADPASSIDFTTIFGASDSILVTAPRYPRRVGFFYESDLNYVTFASGSGENTYIVPKGPSLTEPGTLTWMFHSDGRISITSPTVVPFSVGDSWGNVIWVQASNITKDAITVNLSGYYKLLATDPDNAGVWTIELDAPENQNADWTDIAGMTGGFCSGSAVVRQGLTYPGFDADMLNMSGEYTIDTVSAKTITLLNPVADNADWIKVVYNTNYMTMTLEAAGSDTNWVGPFVLDTDTMNEIIANFVAPAGLWKDNGTTQFTFDVEVQLGVTACDAAGTSLGPEAYYNTTILGSDQVRSQRAKTLRTELSNTGRVKVRCRRLTNKDTTFAGTISDEVKWRDIYSVSPVTQLHFGDVTTVHSLTQATESALAVKDRQINILVQRKLPLRISGSTFSGTLTGTNDIAEIIAFVCKDAKLGNRPNEEIDFDNIYDTIDAVETYFGIPEVREFCYTFDSDNVSFEEMLDAIAQVAFCEPYRQGNVIRLFFEKLTNDSVLLFNHRNKVPNTEKRSINFGKDYDGIELEYVSPTDDAVVTFYVPEDRSAIRPQTIQTIGIRSLEQAHLTAYRAYNKNKFRHTIVEMVTTQQADILVRGERILVADNTRAYVQDGEIVGQDALILQTSQPVLFESGVDYTIFLQHASGTVQALAVTPGVDAYHVVIPTAPAETLSLDANAFVRTLYMVVRSEEGTDRRAFLLNERDTQDNFTSKLTAYNYDSRFYNNDQDFAP